MGKSEIADSALCSSRLIRPACSAAAGAYLAVELGGLHVLPGGQRGLLVSGSTALNSDSRRGKPAAAAHAAAAKAVCVMCWIHFGPCYGAWYSSLSSRYCQTAQPWNVPLQRWQPWLLSAAWALLVLPGGPWGRCAAASCATRTRGGSNVTAGLCSMLARSPG